MILRLPPTVTPASGGLPPATPVFTGRDVQLKEIHGRLAHQGPDTPGGVGVAVTMLVGLGGVGKTELALQAAHRAVAEPGWFPGGLLFVDLFGYDDERRLSPEQALDTLLRYLAVPVQHMAVPTAAGDRAAVVEAADELSARVHRRRGEAAVPAVVEQRQVLALERARVPRQRVQDGGACAARQTDGQGGGAAQDEGGRS